MCFRFSIINVSGIYSLGTPDITTIQSRHQTLSSVISTLVTNISTHESNTKTYSLVDLETLIIALKQSVETWSSQGRTPIDQYETGGFSLESSTQILTLAITPVDDLQQQYSKQLDDAWASEEYYAFTLPRERETKGIWQAIGGVGVIMYRRNGRSGNAIGRCGSGSRRRNDPVRWCGDYGRKPEHILRLGRRYGKCRIQPPSRYRVFGKPGCIAYTDVAEPRFRRVVSHPLN